METSKPPVSEPEPARHRADIRRSLLRVSTAGWVEFAPGESRAVGNPPEGRLA